jgi:hypothetical protein
VFETIDLTALRIDAGHDVADDAVFARGIHRLKMNSKPCRLAA